MFSKSRINEPGPKAEAEKPKAPETPMTKPSMDFTPSAPKGKAGASVLSSDLTVVGNLRTTGDIQVEGTVEAVEDFQLAAAILGPGQTVSVHTTLAADVGTASSDTGTKSAYIAPTTPVPSEYKNGQALWHSVRAGSLAVDPDGNVLSIEG